MSKTLISGKKNVGCKATKCVEKDARKENFFRMLTGILVENILHRCILITAFLSFFQGFMPVMNYGIILPVRIIIKPSFSLKTKKTMLRWVLIFLVVALIAAIFGFGGIAAGAASIAKIIFYIFLVLLVIALIMNFARR